MEERKQGNPKIIYLFIAVIVATILTGIFLLLAAFILLKSGGSKTMVTALIIAANCIPVFIAGFFLGKKVEEKRFIWGFIAAAICFLIYLLFAMIYDKNAELSIGNYVRTFLLMAGGGMLGGMLS